MITTANRMALFAVTIALLANVAPNDALAQEESPPSSGQMAENLNPANWRMPQWKLPSIRGLLPSTGEKAAIKKKKDGLFAEVTKTASNSWARTKEALNPQKLNPVNFLPASARMPSAEKPSESKPGFFRSLFSPVTSQPEDPSVNNFLRQSRLDP